MFVQDGARHSYPRPQRRRGWGRILVLAAALVLASGRLAYGSGPQASERVVVASGDTVWSIATAHYRGDPRPHVEAIFQANRLPAGGPRDAGGSAAPRAQGRARSGRPRGAARHRLREPGARSPRRQPHFSGRDRGGGRAGARPSRSCARRLAVGVGGPAPPAGFPPTHCPGRAGRHRRELWRPCPRAGGYVEVRNSLIGHRSLRVAEPSSVWWSTPSDERRKYRRAFDAIPANRAKKKARQKAYY